MVSRGSTGGIAISVVIPAYNAEGCISRALESVVAWKGDDLEVVVVDDGSEDGTYAAAGSFACRDDRVIVIRQKNGGRSSARNIGIAAAQGEWLMFVDADDYLLPGWNESVREALLQQGNSVDLFIFSMRRSDQGDLGVSASSSASQRPSVRMPASMLKDVMVEGDLGKLESSGLRGFEWNACWARLFRRDLVLKAATAHGGAPFPCRLRFSEDRLFNLAVLETIGNGEIALLDAAIYYWDLGLSSTVMNLSLDDALSLIDFAAAVSDMGFERDADKLIAQEVFMQFGRSASLSASLLPAAARSWKRLLESPSVSRIVPLMSRLADGRHFLYRLSIFLIRKHTLLPALVMQHAIQFASNALRTIKRLRRGGNADRSR